MLLQVVRAAEETAAMLALSISPDQCIKVLCPIIQSADYPINLAAIKMQTKVMERVPRDGLISLLPEIVPGLIQVKFWSRQTHSYMNSFPLTPLFQTTCPAGF